MTRNPSLRLLAVIVSLALGGCEVEFQPSVVPIDWTAGAEGEAFPSGSIVPGLDVFYESESDFTSEQRAWIEQALDGWGGLIGEERFASLVTAGAQVDGNSQYLIRYSGAGGAGHLDQQGVVQFGEQHPSVSGRDRRGGGRLPIVDLAGPGSEIGESGNGEAFQQGMGCGGAYGRAVVRIERLQARPGDPRNERSRID